GVTRPFGASDALYAYDPRLDRWSVLPNEAAPTSRAGLTAVWSGDEMIIWGGFTNDSTGRRIALRDGAAYSPAAQTWRSLPTNTLYPARFLHTAVWTGREM